MDEVMESRTPPPREHGPSGILGPSGIFPLFLALAGGGFLVALLTNRTVLTPEVYRGFLTGPETSMSQVDLLIEAARRWEVWGYLLGPLVLAVRIGTAALLVQLALLATGCRVALPHIVRGALWAQVATWLGSAIQATWLSSLPPGALTREMIQALPGSIAAFLPSLANGAPGPALLAQQVTLFDLGWVLIFAITLQVRETLAFGRALAAVTGVWTVLTLARWGVYLYIGGLV